MSVNKNIGFFRGIVESVNSLNKKNNINIQPVVPMSVGKIDYNTLKTLVVKETPGMNNSFHWNFHKWGDNNNVVGK